MRYCRTADQFHERVKYKTFKVDFRALDLTMGELPAAEGFVYIR